MISGEAAMQRLGGRNAASTEPLKVLDPADCRFATHIRLDRAIAEPLMIRLTVIVYGEVTSSFAKRPHTAHNLGFDRLADVGVHPLAEAAEARCKQVGCNDGLGGRLMGRGNRYCPALHA
jgi:hypothetical protein